MNKRIYKIKDQINAIKDAALNKAKEEYKKRYPDSTNDIYYIIPYILPMFNIKNKCFFAVVVRSYEKYKDPNGEKHFLKESGKYGELVMSHRINCIINVYVESAYTYTIEGVGEPEDIADKNL